MSSNQLALEILSLSAGLQQFSNFQLVNLGAPNLLVNVAPELIQFISSCSSCDNFLASLFQSGGNGRNGQNNNGNIDISRLNLGQCSGCANQLIDLQGLFVSGFDAEGRNLVPACNIGGIGGQGQGLSNNTENVGNGNETAVVDENASNNETEVVGEAEQGKNETEVVDEEGAVKKEVDEEKKEKERKVKRGLVQRSAAGKASKVQVWGSVCFGAVMLVGGLAL